MYTQSLGQSKLAYRYLTALQKSPLLADQLLSGHTWLLHVGYCEVYHHTFVFGLLERKFLEYSFSRNEISTETKVMGAKVLSADFSLPGAKVQGNE